MCLGKHVCQRDLARLSQHLDPLLDITSVQGSIEPQSVVIHRLSDPLHLPELIYLTGSGIKEVELVERPHYLVALLGDVKISQLQSSLSQPVEQVLLLQLLACLECNVEVPAGQSQVETLPDILLEE